MSKKSFKGILGITALVLVSVALILSGCDSPTDFNITESIQSIKGPANVTITPQTGALKLEWDLVTDANGYEIRRKEDVKDARYVAVGLENRYTNEFLDIISDDNILEDGKTYVYQVIAISGSSTRAVGEVVQSGFTEKKSAVVPAGTFPARGTAVVKPVTDVTADIAINGHVTVTWESDNVAPVTYTFLQYFTNNAVPQDYAPEDGIEGKHAYLNVWGEGYLNGAVYAEWPNNYYPPSALAALTEKDYAIPTIVLGVAVPAPTVTRTINSVFNRFGTVAITWSPIDGATGYILQKYQVTGDPTYNAEAAVWTTLDATQTTTRNLITVEDNVAPADSAWYRLIVQTAKGTTSPSSVTKVGTVDPITTSVGGALNVFAQQVTDDNSVTANPTIIDTSVNAIYFEVTATRPGYTYSIYRQKVGEANGVGNTATGDYELVPGIPVNFGPAAGNLLANGTINGTVKLQYEPTPQRQNYNYELRTYKDGESVGTDNQGATPAKNAINIGAVTNSADFGTAPTVTRWYGVTPAGLGGNAYNSQLMSGEAVHIYARLNPPAVTAPSVTGEPSSTADIGTAGYIDLATYTTPTGEIAPPATGYWVKVNGDYDLSTLRAEVK